MGGDGAARGGRRGRPGRGGVPRLVASGGDRALPAVAARAPSGAAGGVAAREIQAVCRHVQAGGRAGGRRGVRRGAASVCGGGGGGARRRGGRGGRWRRLLGQAARHPRRVAQGLRQVLWAGGRPAVGCSHGGGGGRTRRGRRRLRVGRRARRRRTRFGAARYATLGRRGAARVQGGDPARRARPLGRRRHPGRSSNAAGRV